MSTLPSPASILLLLSLSLPPRPPLSPSSLLSTLSWPLTLLLHPPTSPLLTPLPPTSIRKLGIARSVEHYALAWAFLGFLGASMRIYGRIRSRITGQHSTQSNHGLATKKILAVRPIVTAVVWHLISWRLVILPTISVEKAGGARVGGMDWPLDIPTIIGVGGGLIASWGEMSRLLGLFGWNKDPQTGPSWTLSITHVVLSIHRLLLGIRLLSSGIATLSSSSAAAAAATGV